MDGTACFNLVSREGERSTRFRVQAVPNAVNERLGSEPADKSCLIQDKSGNLDILHRVGKADSGEEGVDCTPSGILISNSVKRLCVPPCADTG